MKQGWEIKKIIDICDKASSNIAQNKIVELDGDYPVFGASGFVQNVDFYHRDTAYIGVVKDGSGVGRVNVYPAYSSLLGTLQYILPKEGYTLNYVAYTLKSLNLASFASGAAIPHIYFKDYGEVEIPVPPLSEQEKIVEELDCLSGVIEKKREQLKELDALAESIFYTMFGDPITNEKGWEVKKLRDIATSQIGITYKPENVSDNDEGVVVLRSSNIQDSTLCFEDIVRVDCAIKENKYVRGGDILMCTRNGSFRLVGKVAMIANMPERMTYGAFMTIIRSDYQSYLFAFFKSPAFRSQLTTSKTATINQITVKMLDEIKVALPPITLQQEFADKIEAIEKQKELIKQSIKETETLFNARMQYYFGERP